MIISKTPFRISFFGGGTDFPKWYEQYGGAVLSTTIDKYCYISVRKLPPFFKYKHRLVYSKTELVDKFSEINHPSIRETLKFLKVSHGIEIHHDGDLPARSGLGSSSAFTVGLLNVLKALEGRYIDAGGLAKSAINIEHNLIRESGGSQDQIAAAYGGFNHITFNQDLSFKVVPLILKPRVLEELESGLVLFYSGIERLADKIEKDKLSKLFTKKSMDSLKFTSYLVGQAKEVLTKPEFSLSDFGRLLHRGWLSKQQLSKKVSNSHIDAIYKKAIKAGAYGGKVLGAGGGGFILFCMPPQMKTRLIKALSPLIHVPFKFDPQGSRIALYAPNSI